MSKKNHNKKRNVGIIYEQLVLKLSEALIEENDNKFKSVKKILKEFYSKGTEIHKEYQLINSLATIDINDTSIIPIILEETKKATWKVNKVKLNKEKSFLIKEINKVIGKNLFSTKISNYKDYATVSILIEEYKKTNKADPSILVSYTNKTVDILKRKKLAPGSLKDIKEMKNLKIDNLVVKLMFEKFNKNYNDKFSEEQINLLNEWVTNKNEPKIRNMVITAKTKALYIIEEYKKSCSNDVLMSKVATVEKNIRKESFEIINEAAIIKAMTMYQIINELESGE